MSIENSIRSNFSYDQVMIAKNWMKRASKLDDPFLVFISYFTAFNSLYWCCSDEDTDLKMLPQFKEVFRASLSNDEISKMARLSRGIISFIMKEFGEVHKLHKRTNNRTAPALKYDNLSLATIVQNGLDEPKEIDVCISLLYQFRCNLVHGSKNISLDENEKLAKEFNHFMEELVELTIRKMGR